MRRAALLLVVLPALALAGCAESGDPEAASEPGQDVAALDTLPAAGQEPEVADAAPEPARDLRRVEGRYRAVKPTGEPLQEEGGRIALEVSGWSDVEATLDSSIEVDLVLLPPGCAGVDAECALRFSPPEGETDGQWTVDRMAPGTWTVAVEADEDDYSYVEGVYAVGFSFVAA